MGEKCAKRLAPEAHLGEPKPVIHRLGGRKRKSERLLTPIAISNPVGRLHGSDNHPFLCFECARTWPRLLTHTHGVRMWIVGISESRIKGGHPCAQGVLTLTRIATRLPFWQHASQINTQNQIDPNNPNNPKSTFAELTLKGEQKSKF